MADIRPIKFPSSTQTKTYRYAEQLLHQASVGLPAGWYALYEVHWVGPTGGATAEGECDFVFVAPEIGLVVVEVKGGGIGCDAQGWYSVDRKGERHRIKDPAAQAQRGRFALLSYINQIGRGDLLRGHCTSHMVCFPNIRKSSLPPLPGLDPALVIDCDDLAALADSLRAGSCFFHGSAPRGLLSLEACREIADVLKPAFEVPSRWASHIFQQRFEIDKLTAEQQRAFGLFTSNKTISLTGPAGSGKTVVAAQQARRQAREGDRVLVIVPTKALRHFYSTMIGAEAVTVVLHDAAAAQLSGQWDLILLDEAQDFPPDLMESVRAYCDRNDTRLIAVHDSNQRLVAQHAELLGRFTQVHFSKVLRNTSQIGELAGRFYLNSRIPPEIAGPPGLPVKEIPVREKTDVPAAVSKYVADLVEGDGFAFRDIVVLFGSSNGALLRAGGQNHGGVGFRNAADVWAEGCDDARCVACCGIKAFRGMESPVVILCEVDDLLGQQLIEGCYVGMSRAQHVLAIVGLGGTLDRIRAVDLNPVVVKRQKRAERTRERAQGAERVAERVRPGACCLGVVTGVQWYGVFFRLVEFGCPALLRREEVTNDRTLDLKALYSKGQEVNVVVRSVNGGRVSLSLPRGISPGRSRR